MPKKPVLQGGAIITYGGSVVLRRNKGGKWIFPKGHVDRGETTAQTAAREAEEETGLLVEVVEPAGAVTFKTEGEKVTVEYYLLRAREPGPRWERHHNVDTFLVRPEQVAAYLSHGNLRRLWEEVRERVLALLEPAPTPGV